MHILSSLALALSNADPLPDAHDTCPSILRFLPDRIGPYGDQSVLSRLNEGQQELAIDSLAKWMSESGTKGDPSFLGPDQIEVPLYLRVMKLSDVQIQKFISERLLKFLHYSNALIETSERHRLNLSREVEFPGGLRMSIEKPISEMEPEERERLKKIEEEVLQSYRDQIGGRLGAIARTGISQTLKVPYFRRHLEGLPKINLELTDRAAYLKSLEAAFWIAVAARDRALSGQFFMHMLYAGQPSMAARAAFTVHHEPLLMFVGFLALSDALSPDQIRWTSHESPLEVGIEALAGVTDDLAKIGRQKMEALAKALPEIYEQEILDASHIPPEDLCSLQWIQKAQFFAEGKLVRPSTDIFMRDLKTKQPLNFPLYSESNFEALIVRDDRVSLDRLTAYARNPALDTEPYRIVAETLLREGSEGPNVNAPAYRFAQLALSPRILHELIRDDIYRGYGLSSFSLFRALAILEFSSFARE